MKMNEFHCIPVKLYKNRQWAATFSEVGLMCLGVHFFGFILFGYMLLEFVNLHTLPNLGSFSQCFFEYFFSPVSPFWDSKDMTTRSFAKVLLVPDTGLVFFIYFLHSNQITCYLRVPILSSVSSFLLSLRFPRPVYIVQLYF